MAPSRGFGGLFYGRFRALEPTWMLRGLFLKPCLVMGLLKLAVARYGGLAWATNWTY